MTFMKQNQKHTEVTGSEKTNTSRSSPFETSNPSFRGKSIKFLRAFVQTSLILKIKPKVSAHNVEIAENPTSCAIREICLCRYVASAAPTYTST